MATVVGYFQSGPTHEGPNTKSNEVEDDEERGTSVQAEVDRMFDLGAFCVEVDGEEVEATDAEDEDEEATDVVVEEVPEYPEYPESPGYPGASVTPESLGVPEATAEENV